MKVRGLLLCLALVSAAAVGETLNCNLQGYKPVEGLKAEASAQAATLTWSGESGQQLRVHHPRWPATRAGTRGLSIRSILSFMACIKLIARGSI